MIATGPHHVVSTSRISNGRETQYERVAAALWATAISLMLLCFLLISVWLLFGKSVAWPEPIDSPRTGANEMSWTDLISAEAIAVQRPEEAFDAPPTELDISQLEIAEQVAAIAAQPAIEVVSTANSAAGVSQGDFTENLVQGEPVGVTRSKELSRRWVIEVTSPRNIVDYTAMLKGFAIEPALVFSDGRIVYLNVQGDTPSVRYATSFGQENRFYARWTQGDLEQLDEQLFQSAGVDHAGAIIVHFFSATTEALFEQKSLAFAGRSDEQIGRTWFRLEYRQSGAEVEVLRQDGR